ncbi:Acetyltransferase (GNAT) family protein [Pilibacter termitis]|uniref:Acetyltransferase (GNAT) family protein n=1 Tax=Pilibacter termitis TaxID=263852 RepID=A0A1T4LST1_9ENTE|nr:GNAT family N-acetyltransferase [Pilibacter termitis]SJZ57578.1 Acetyltransferase (GNAT) family protein [Pilibacter termitis]
MTVIRKIININEKQLEELLNIWLYSNLEAHSFIPDKYWYQNLLFVKEALVSAEIYSYIDKDKIIGFIGLSNNYIAGLFVNKDYRGRGI